MDLFTFLSNIIVGLAWPVTVIAALLIVKEPLKVLISKLRQFQYKDFNFEFSQIVNNVPEVNSDKSD